MIAPYDLPPLCRTECAWINPWLISRMVQVGTSHYRDGRQMDDCHAVGYSGTTVWLIVADGVGTAPNARFGSAAACRAVHDFLGHHVTSALPVTEDVVRKAFDHAHMALKALAAKEHRTALDYSTTLAIAILQGTTVVAGSVGDSSIVAYGLHEVAGQYKPKLYPFCSGPQYTASNRSHNIAKPDWAAYLNTRSTNSPHIEGILLATDGANSSFLDVLEPGHPFDPRVMTTLHPALQKLTPRVFSNYFAQHMTEVTEENDDDRTLLVAWKPPRSLAPPAEKPRTL